MSVNENFYTNGADDEHLEGFLDYVKGSLSSERRSNRPKNPNIQLKKIRRLSKKFRLKVSDALISPQNLIDRMAEKAALFPTFELADFKIKNIGKIQGKDQYRKILNILLAIYFSNDEEWLKVLLSAPFLKLVPNLPKPGIQCELAFVSKILVNHERSQRNELIEKLYSKQNLRKKIETGIFWLSRLDIYIEFFDVNYVKVSQRKRGYNDKGSRNPDHIRERMKSMKEIQTELEERRLRILAKQMEIFERNLDKLLEIDTSQSRKEAKEVIRQQNQEVQEIYSTEKPKLSTFGGKYYEKINKESNSEETREH